MITNTLLRLESIRTNGVRIIEIALYNIIYNNHKLLLSLHLVESAIER